MVASILTFVQFIAALQTISISCPISLILNSQHPSKPFQSISPFPLSPIHWSPHTISISFPISHISDSLLPFKPFQFLVPPTYPQFTTSFKPFKFVASSHLSLHYLEPSYLLNEFSHSRAIRPPLAKTTNYQGSFRFGGAKIWSFLPLDLRRAHDLTKFKSGLKKHLRSS